MSAFPPDRLAQGILRVAYGSDAIWDRATEDQRAEMSEAVAVFVPIFEKLIDDLAAWLDGVESPDRRPDPSPDRRSLGPLAPAAGDAGRTAGAP